MGIRGNRPKNPYERRPTVRRQNPDPAAEERPGLRELPKDLVELADGRSERVQRPRRQQPAIEDERIGFVVPGVRNLDARAVYDSRVAELRGALARGDEAALQRGLCEAVRLSLWRARSVMDFDAFAESVVGVAPERANELAKAGASVMSVSLEMLPAHVVALWMRIEAALQRACPDGRASVTGRRETLCLEVRVPTAEVGRAVEGFFDMGGAAAGLRPFLRGDAAAAPPRKPRGPESRDRNDRRAGGGSPPRPMRRPRERS